MATLHTSSGIVPKRKHILMVSVHNYDWRKCERTKQFTNKNDLFGSYLSQRSELKFHLVKCYLDFNNIRVSKK